MFSEETNNTVLDINGFSKGKLKNIFELSAFIENSKEEEAKKLFEEIIFKAKYVYGLVLVLSDTANADIVNDKLKGEFSFALLELKEMISSYVGGIPEKKAFEDKFFGMSQESMADFIGFVTDLAYTKEYFNSRKFSENS